MPEYPYRPYVHDYREPRKERAMPTQMEVLEHNRRMQFYNDVTRLLEVIADSLGKIAESQQNGTYYQVDIDQVSEE